MDKALRDKNIFHKLYLLDRLGTPLGDWILQLVTFMKYLETLPYHYKKTLPGELGTVLLPR